MFSPIKTQGHLTLWSEVGQRDVRNAVRRGWTAIAYCGSTWYFTVCDGDGHEVWHGTAVSEEEALAAAWKSAGGHRYA